jgi:dipeptidyl aminopeptidase/acylaminoacyl peptidase
MPRTPLTRFALLLPFAAAVFVPARSPAAENAKEPVLIQASDLLKVKQLESPALSPDGKWVVYVVRSIEAKPETKDDWTYQTHLWLAAADGSTPPRQLTHSAASNSAPVWSPAGDRIAFVRTVEKEKPQVCVLSLAGGEAQPLTKGETGAGNPRWSPDGSRLLFTSALNYAQVRDELAKAGVDALPKWKTEKPGRTSNDTGNWALKVADKDKAKDAPKPKADPDGTLQERREWLAKNEADGNPRPLDRLNFLSESDINPEQTFTHIFVQEARDGAEAKDLTPGYATYAAPEWMPDGKAIVCTGPRKPDENPDRGEFTNLDLVDATAGGTKVFVDLAGYSVGNPAPSPDGKLVAFTATPGEFLGYGQAVVATVPIAGGEPKFLTEKLDRSAGNLKWSHDSRFVYFIAPTNGDFPLYRVAVADGKTTKIDSGGYRDYDLGKDQQVQVLTRASDPYELYAGGLLDGNVGGKPYAMLTRHNADWLTGKKLSAYEPHSLVGRDGLTIEYWTMKPADFDAAKKYPLLLEIHGGPQAMWGPGEDSMWFEFQYFAARGYAIVFANPRGSGGYGYEFQHANYRDWGIGPSSDILSAADFAAKEPYVNKAREVVTGGSYGGYMTAWIVGHDHRFKAAVAQRGVYDLATFFGEGNAWRLVPRAFGGYPWQPEVRAILDRDSPITYVENINTPLLLQHGDNDRRTGFVQSEMMLRSLKVLGRDVEEVRYPRATHELSRSGEPRQRLDTLVRYEEFFRRYIGEN